MRALLFFPFTFVAGLDGFGLFVPYLAALLTTLYVARLAARWEKPVPVPVRVRERKPPRL